MRKMYKRKRGTCGVCHPNKKCVVKRWTYRDELRLREWDRERRKWLT